MSTKRIVLIIMCGLLALMAVLMIVVFSQFVPFLNMLRPAQKPVVQNPSSTATQPTQPVTTTTQKLPTLPSQPPIVTEQGHVHNFQFDRKVDATCETPGYSLYSCSCNMLDMRDLTDPMGHTYGTGKKIVLCEEEGYTEYTCIVCEHKDRQNVTDPPGHDYQLVKTVEPSCTEEGYELHRCSRCEAEKQENEISAKGHTDFVWFQTLAPGVGNPGEETRQCSVCEHKETRDCKMSVMNVIFDDMGDRKEYIIYVGTSETPNALTYTVKDYSRSREIETEYTEDGLLIRLTSFTGEKHEVRLARLENVSAVIDASGELAEGTPTVPPTTPTTNTTTQPTVPTGTQPTTPTGTQPTVPTTTQPLGTTGTQPTVPTGQPGQTTGDAENE